MLGQHASIKCDLRELRLLLRGLGSNPCADLRTRADGSGWIEVTLDWNPLDPDCMAAFAIARNPEGLVLRDWRFCRDEVIGRGAGIIDLRAALVAALGVVPPLAGLERTARPSLPWQPLAALG